MNDVLKKLTLSCGKDYIQNFIINFNYFADIYMPKAMAFYLRIVTYNQTYGKCNHFVMYRTSETSAFFNETA